MADQTLLTQLSRIEGQVRGIQKMLEEERSCLDVLQQVVAARAGLSKIGAELLKADLRTCVRSEDQASFDQVMAQLFKLS